MSDVNGRLPGAKEMTFYQMSKARFRAEGMVSFEKTFGN